MFIRPYAQIGPRRGKRGKGKRHKRHEGQRQRQNQEAEAEAKGTGREARGKPPGPARTYKKNFPVWFWRSQRKNPTLSVRVK